MFFLKGEVTVAWLLFSYRRLQKKVLSEITKGALWSQQLMIPTHGGLYSTKPLLQLVESLLSPKSYLRLLMLGSWDSWEFLPLVFLQWRILPYCFMTIMRWLNVSYLSSVYHSTLFSLLIMTRIFPNRQFLKDSVYLDGIKVYEHIIRFLSSFDGTSNTKQDE